jgi:hypothetical protein
MCRPRTSPGAPGFRPTGGVSQNQKEASHVHQSPEHYQKNRADTPRQSGEENLPANLHADLPAILQPLKKVCAKLTVLTVLTKLTVLNVY